MKNEIQLNYYIIAGEASGDLHGANLMKHLKLEHPASTFRVWGGDNMVNQGGVLVKHIKELAFMGFVEVVRNLTTILKNIRFCKEDIEAFNPDALILIDYPGFNLRIAEWAKSKGIKVIYYISPQVWAWKQSRVTKIKQHVDEMYVILPFEKAFYERFNMDVTYLGHPLLDAIEEYKETAKTTKEFLAENNLSDKPIIAILPGSRKQEINLKLPIMLEGLHKFNDYQLVVAGAPTIDNSFYHSLLLNHNVKIVYGQTYDLLFASEAAVVTSGTATLETALIGVPEVVCYIGSPISYTIAKRLIKIKFISLVNLILDKEVVKELIQDDCTPIAIHNEVGFIVKNGMKREAILENYNTLTKKLGAGGASKKIAAKITQSMLKTIQTG
jgi:lipid-A-disaccharide synthase